MTQGARAAVRAVCFDLDGTLINSLPELYEGARLAALELDLPDPGEKRVGDMIGAGVRVLAERLCRWWREAAPEADPARIDPESALKLLVEKWESLDGSRIAAIPGAFEGITALHAAGLRTALVTNKVRTLTLELLEAHGWTPLFDVVVTGSDCDRLKPYPDLLELALAKLGVAPREAVMVGDSRNDALAARAAGVRACLVESGYNEGVPLAEWAASAGFSEVYSDAGAVCRHLLEEKR